MRHMMKHTETYCSKNTLKSMSYKPHLCASYYRRLNINNPMQTMDKM